MIIVHAGNRVDAPDRATPRFPSDNEEAVQLALAELIAELQPRTVVSAAAAGADLLMLAAAEQAEVSTVVVLPLTKSEFRQRSVDDLGKAWTDRYHQALGAADAVVVDDLSEYDDWYLRGNAVIIEQAQRLATADEDVVAIVVSDLEQDSSSATAHFAGVARDRGLRVISIDPLAV